MAIVFFDSLNDCEINEVELVSPEGESVQKRLLIDSGFTGESCLILSTELGPFALATIAASHATGALHGRQTRILMTCRVPELTFQRNLIAIVTDVGALSLPPDIDGMAGQSFLRQFARWGAEKTPDDAWHFFLANA